jgi:hypothetical protein
MLHHAARGDLGFYLDLHAHANKKGVFVYGNTLTDPAAALQALVRPLRDALWLHSWITGYAKMDAACTGMHATPHHTTACRCIPSWWP